MIEVGKKPLRLVEIQESVLPEDEWIIGISILDYFNGVGYSMPMRLDRSLSKEVGLLTGGTLTSDLIASSNIDDQLKTESVTNGDEDRLLSGIYKHKEDPVRVSSGTEDKGLHIDVPQSSILVESLFEDDESANLYAFLPGIFYCSGQQTSVDAVLIEVTQTQRFGMTLSSFRPEDVRALDVSKGFVFDENKGRKSVKVTVDTLGSFHFEDFLKDSGLSTEVMSYSKEVELAKRLSSLISFSELKEAYASSSFLRSRLVKLLDDIDFFGLAPRRRIYVRNKKHPYGRVIDVNYKGFDSILNLGVESGISCADEIDLEHQLNNLVFTKLMGMGIETNVEVAIMEIFQLIETGLKGKVSHREVLNVLSREGLR
ncbi:MAG: hypothetical protein ACFFDV_06385 [Candidatus Thorarchaeota archaeon]